MAGPPTTKAAAANATAIRANVWNRPIAATP
jgi:hypothetical protein